MHTWLIKNCNRQEQVGFQFGLLCELVVVWHNHNTHQPPPDFGIDRNFLIGVKIGFENQSDRMLVGGSTRIEDSLLVLAIPAKKPHELSVNLSTIFASE